MKFTNYIASSKSKPSICLLSSSPWLISFENQCHLTIDKTYRPFLLTRNESYSVEKLMFVLKIPKIMNRIMLFGPEYAEHGLNYN